MKPIKVEANYNEIIRQAFEAKLGAFVSANGKFDFNFDLKQLYADKMKDMARPLIRMTPLSYLQMRALVQNCSDEIGWHGTVQRLGPSEFLIDRIICFPQSVTGTTVNSDDAKYPMWLMKLDNDTATHLHFHGHSHVNMAVSPSGVDDNTWANFLRSLSGEVGDDFYIFCIANKRDDIGWRIYDLANNMVFEPTDIDFEIDVDDKFCIKEWAKDQIDQNVVKRSYLSGNSYIPQAITARQTCPPLSTPPSSSPYSLGDYYDEYYMGGERTWGEDKGDRSALYGRFSGYLK